MAITYSSPNPKKKFLAKKLLKTSPKPKSKTKPKSSLLEKAKDVLEEVEEFSYAQLEEVQVEIDIVKPAATRKPNEVTHPPSRRSSNIVKLKEVELLVKRWLLLVQYSDEKGAYSPLQKKSKEAILSSSSSSKDDLNMVQTLINAKRLSIGKNLKASKSLGTFLLALILLLARVLLYLTHPKKRAAMMNKLKLAWTLMPRPWRKYQKLRPKISMWILSEMFCLGFTLQCPGRTNGL